MKKIVTRTITGVIYISIVIGAILWSVWSFMALFLLITIVCLHEFYRITSSEDLKPQKYMGIFLGVVLYITLTLYAHKVLLPEMLLINLALIFVIFIIELYRKQQKPFTNIGITLLGAYYVALPFAFLNFFYSPYELQGEFHVQLLLGFFILTWLTETVAYLVGSAIGRHKLFERISPKKTWEGFIAALLSGVGIAYVLSLVFTEHTLVDWLIISFIIVIIGTFGDLSESMLKRSYGLKDSGSIMPGHGGLLDRFDSTFFSAVFVFIYMVLFIAN